MAEGTKKVETLGTTAAAFETVKNEREGKYGSIITINLEESSRIDLELIKTSFNLFALDKQGMWRNWEFARYFGDQPV